jgi:hypothetical protein
MTKISLYIKESFVNGSLARLLGAMRLVMVLIAASGSWLGGGGGAFVVAGEAAVSGEPGQGAFDAPSAWNDGEAVLAFGFAHGVHHGGEDDAGPDDELAAVGEDEADRADQVRREQGGLGTVTVLHARGEHDDHDEHAQGVGDDEPLPAVDLLAGVRVCGQLRRRRGRGCHRSRTARS